MIRVIMFDLGNTLVRESDRTLFPHVSTALTALSGFSTDLGDPVPLCLVSNFPAQLPVPPALLPQVFASFLQILDEAQLRSFFEPVVQRVTLSAHAGVAKPAAVCFTEALERLGLAVGFDACLFITEEAAHITNVRGFGMHALQFGGHQDPSPAGSDFTDWAEAPLLIARAAFPENHNNMKSAVRGFLEATHPLSVSSVKGAGNQFAATAAAHVPLPGNLSKALTGVLIDVPVQVQVQLDDRGKPIQVVGTEPSPADVSDVALNVESLVSSGQIAGLNESPLGPTYHIATNSKGERVLKRNRYTV